jgi:hypothetical protein
MMVRQKMNNAKVASMVFYEMAQSRLYQVQLMTRPKLLVKTQSQTKKLRPVLIFPAKLMEI